MLKIGYIIFQSLIFTTPLLYKTVVTSEFKKVARLLQVLQIGLVKRSHKNKDKCETHILKFIPLSGVYPYFGQTKYF